MRRSYLEMARHFNLGCRHVTLCVSVAGAVSVIACQGDVVGPPASPQPLPGAPSPVPAERWLSPGGEDNSPSASSGSVGSVLAHNGSADPVSIGGTFKYRTIVQATFTGAVSRTWNIAGQPPAPDYGPAGPGGNGDGGIVLGGGSISNGAVTSSLGNVSSVTMYLPLQGQYTIGRSSLGQPSHDNPACGPSSSEPFFDCICQRRLKLHTFGDRNCTRRRGRA